MTDLKTIVLPVPTVNTQFAALTDRAFMGDVLWERYHGAYIKDIGGNAEEVMRFHFPDTKTKTLLIEFMVNNVIPLMQQHGIKDLTVASPKWFKALTGVAKKTKFGTPYAVEVGKVTINIHAVPNITALQLNSTTYTQKDLMKTAYDCVHAVSMGLPPPLDHPLPKHIEDVDLQELSEYLNKYKDVQNIAVDIEGYGLKFHECRIATIAFAHAPEEGVGIIVDQANPMGLYSLLKSWFTYRHKNAVSTLYHGSTFDIKVIVFEVFMNRILSNHRGLVDGVTIMCTHVADSMQTAYLAKNSTSRAALDLKSNTQTVFGDYGINVTDISVHPIEVILGYNIKDSCATKWLYNQTYPMIIASGQAEVYKFLNRSIKTLVQAELSGMYVDPVELHRLDKSLESTIAAYAESIEEHTEIAECLLKLRTIAQDKANAKLKVKVKPIEDFKHIVFLPGSPAHLQYLIYTKWGIPIESTTQSGQPSTDGAAMARIIPHLSDTQTEVLKLIMSYNEDVKIRNTFVKGILENSKYDELGNLVLLGNYSITGTISGRLSSYNINLLNLPASRSSYAKAIKKLFIAPPGYLMVGADMYALEAMINALITKDPQKLKVYIDNIDSHCLNAYFYFKKVSDETPQVPEDGSIKTYKYKGDYYTEEELNEKTK